MIVVPARARPWLVALGVVAVIVLAAYLRFDGLGRPGRIYFDESYYVEDARSYLRHGVEAERPAHPPMGKWVIAAGIELVGDRPIGWRSANAALGTLTVVATMAAGRLLTRRWWPALVAGLLVTLDGLAFVSSRIGMLDGSLSWWVTAAFLLLVLDHRRLRLGPIRPGAWRVAAGVALGLAVATKWSGLLALPAAVAVAALGDLGQLRTGWSDGDGDAPSTSRRTRARTRIGGLARHGLVRLAVPFAVVPAAVYVAAYVPWLIGYEHTETAGERCEAGQCGTGVVDRLAGWWYEQRELVAFHDRLQATHPDRSEAWQWPVLDEPVLMYLERCKADATDCPYEPDEQRRILGLGSPALWWPALLGVPALAVVAWRRRWWAGAAAVAFAVAQWAPWLAAPKPGFSFYLIPVVPFVALAMALLCTAVRPRAGRLLAAVLLLAAVAAFTFWRPLYVGSVLDRAEVERRAWFPSWD